MIHSTTNLACLLQSAFVRPACISIKSQYKDPNMRYLSHSWPPGSSPFSFPFLSVYLYQRWWTKNKLFFCGRVDDKVIWAGYTSTWLDLILCTIQSVYKEKVLMILNLVVVFHPWTWTAHLHWMCSHYTSKGSGWRISRRSFNMNPSNSHASFSICLLDLSIQNTLRYSWELKLSSISKVMMKKKKERKNPKILLFNV